MEHRLHAACMRPRPSVMNSIFFRVGDRIEWPIVLAFALLRCENRCHRALHLFAGMRNLLGMPNTPNVLTAYPLLMSLHKMERDLKC
ncbi:unnamed protein product [Urochloa humidicola]